MKKQRPPFGFNVQRILDCGFQIEESIIPELNDALISYGMAFYFDQEESWAQFNIRADFFMHPNQIFATGTVLTRFGINELKTFCDKNGDIIWPINSLETMFGLAFNHMRAIVAKNMAGTRFSNYVVPLNNPSVLFEQLINQNQQYEIEKIPFGTVSEMIKLKNKISNSSLELLSKEKKNIEFDNLEPTKPKIVDSIKKQKEN